MAPPSQVTILGAGLTGLTAAWRLTTLSPSTRVTVIDSSDRVGGWVKSEKKHLTLPKDQGGASGTVVLESGPRSIRPRGSKGAAGMLKLAKIHELGIQDTLVPIPKSHPSAQNRFILDLSTSPPRIAPMRLNPLSIGSQPSLSTLLSASVEPFRRNKSASEDESVDSFLRRRFGDGVADLASAGMHGIYAASSAQLSARAVLGKVHDVEQQYGSVLYGMWRRSRTRSAKKEKADEAKRWEGMGQVAKDKDDWAMYGLKGGLHTLTDALHQRLKAKGVEIRMNESVNSLLAVDGQVKISTQSGPFEASNVISSLPPRHLGPLLWPTLPHLAHNPYTNVGVVTFVFPLPPSQIHPDGFGYLIPRPSPGAETNKEGVLGVVFDSTALPGLDEGLESKVTKLTVMMGGPYWFDPNYASGSLSQPQQADELVPLATAHLHKVFPHLQQVDPLYVARHLHTNAIPTYVPGHFTRLNQLHTAILQGPWRDRLSLTGNGYGGVGVNDCVWSAEIVVEALARGQSCTGLEAYAEPWSP